MIYGPSRNENGIALWECWHGGMLALCNTLKTEEINKTQLSDFEFVKCWDDYLKWVKWWMGACLGLMVHSWVCPYSYNIVHMYYIHLIHYDYDLKHGTRVETSTDQYRPATLDQRSSGDQYRPVQTSYIRQRLSTDQSSYTGPEVEYWPVQKSYTRPEVK